MNPKHVKTWIDKYKLFAINKNDYVSIFTANRVDHEPVVNK